MHHSSAVLKYLVLPALLVGCAAPGKTSVPEPKSKPALTISEPLLKEAWQTCSNPRTPRLDYLKAKVDEYPDYYPEVKGWLSSGIATRAYADLQRRNRYYRCIDVSLTYLALADPSKFVSDLPFFVETWIDVSISDQFNGRFDNRLRHVRSAFHAASQAAQTGTLSAGEIKSVRDYLFDSIQPSTWQTRNTAWQFDTPTAQATGTVALVESAINAYAVTPGGDVVDKLDGLRDDQALKDLLGHSFDKRLDQAIALANASAGDSQPD